MKKFSDYEGWEKKESIKSTEELVKILTRLAWGMYWEGIRVQFFDIAKEDLVFLSTSYRQEFFETLGEVSPEEVEYIKFYSKDCNFELENEGSAWSYCIGVDTVEEDLYRDKIQKSANYGKIDIDDTEKVLVSTSYGKNNADKQAKNLISTNYGKKSNFGRR